MAQELAKFRSRSKRGKYKILRILLCIRASDSKTLKFIMKKSKFVSLAQEIGFSAPNLCSLPWLVKGATHFLCTSKKKECNKSDLTCGSVFLIG
jgi:hypothetical protein